MSGISSQDQPVFSREEVSSKYHDKGKLKITLSYQWVSITLLLIIVGMFMMWKPWAKSPQISDRTIKVTGETTLHATPDEFIFSPSYDFTNSNKEAALMALTTQSAMIIAQLKTLGVTDKQIKTNSSGGEPYYSYYLNGNNSSTYTLQLTVTVDSSTLAQKVQDYLTTTSPMGAVSPQANFSDTKQKSLQSQARDAATKDARAKADQTAKNLGFRLGAVRSVDDSSANSPIFYRGVMDSTTSANGANAKPSLAIQTGQNTFDYSVNVVYYIR